MALQGPFPASFKPALATGSGTDCRLSVGATWRSARTSVSGRACAPPAGSAPPRASSSHRSPNPPVRRPVKGQEGRQEEDVSRLDARWLALLLLGSRSMLPHTRYPSSPLQCRPLQQEGLVRYPCPQHLPAARCGQDPGDSYRRYQGVRDGRSGKGPGRRAARDCSGGDRAQQRRTGLGGGQVSIQTAAGELGMASLEMAQHQPLYPYPLGLGFCPSNSGWQGYSASIQ